LAGAVVKLTVIYIISPGHSGSTLLDLLVASHSRVVTVGEATNLSASRRDPLTMRCTCGSGTLRHCAFWAAVDAELQRTAGLTLERLDLRSADPRLFSTHNRALFAAVANVSGQRMIVDSSKSPSRLERLFGLDGLDVRPVQLRRAPQGVVYSNVKKGRSWIRYALAYGLHYVRADRVLKQRNFHRIEYESLATDPCATLASLMDWLGLPFEERQLAWRDHPHHSVAGNRMRLGPLSEISLDDSWKTGLSPLQKLGTSVLAGRGLAHAAQLAARLRRHQS
jgi:hypothetical protein